MCLNKFKMCLRTWNTCSRVAFMCLRWDLCVWEEDTSLYVSVCELCAVTSVYKWPVDNVSVPTCIWVLEMWKGERRMKFFKRKNSPQAWSFNISILECIWVSFWSNLSAFMCLLHAHFTFDPTITCKVILLSCSGFWMVWFLVGSKCFGQARELRIWSCTLAKRNWHLCKQGQNKH